MKLIFKAILATILLPGTATALVPWGLLRTGIGRFDLGAARWAGLAPMALGAAALLWCIFDFFRVGRGTLAPVDPPKVVVDRGLYGWVRNPMYVSVVTVLIGEALVFQSWLIAAWGAVAFLVFHLFVMLHEEPALRRAFGDSYEAYRNRVPRWLPSRPPR